MTDEYAQLIARYRFPGEMPWVQPAYDGQSTINLTHSLLAHFGLAHGTPLGAHAELASVLAGKRKLLVLLLDGLGWLNLERAIARCPIIGKALAPTWRMPLTTVFPSTTSAAITSIVTGLPPAQHGVIGFLMYFPQYGRVFNTLNFRAPEDPHLELTTLGFVPETYIGHPSLMRRLRNADILSGGYVDGAYAGSGLSRLVYHDCAPYAYATLGDLFGAALEQLTAPVPQCLLLYWAALDTIAHTYGAGSTAYAYELQMLATVIREQVIPQLDAESALLIIADHGHIDGDDARAINLMPEAELRQLFRVPPAGEGQAMQLFIQPEAREYARTLLARIDDVTILTRQQMLQLGLLGAGPLHPRLSDALADFLLLPHHGRRLLYHYQPRPHTAMIGRHGGLTHDEMVVPLLVFTERV